MNKTVLRNYAKLIVRIGANVQKGQEVVINASVDDAYFVKYVVEYTFENGINTKNPKERHRSFGFLLILELRGLRLELLHRQGGEHRGAHSDNHRDGEHLDHQDAGGKTHDGRLSCWGS